MEEPKKNSENQDASVTKIAPGQSRNHFISIAPTSVPKGDLYNQQLMQDEWKVPEKKKEENVNSKSTLFATEVDDEVLENARKRLNQDANGNVILIPETWELAGVQKMRQQEDSEEIKTSLLETANEYYEKSTKHFDKCEFEQAIISINKALNLNTFNLQFHLTKCDAYIQLGDIKSAILTLNKLLSLIVSLSSNNENIEQYDAIKADLSEKLAFYYYLEGQTFYDCKYYLEALDCFTKASELRPNYMPYRIRSVSCLVSLNRTNEALAFVNKIIEESEEMQQNVHLYVLRARLHLKYNNQTLCYYDLRDALSLEPNHEEASHLMKMIEDAAEQLRNSSLILSLNGRISDALNKIAGAIAMNPAKAEFNLQRGILYKRLKNFNAAIDDFILGLDKMDHNAAKEPELFKNLQRQILLTYNEFAIQCYNKWFYDESILLLNKAIRLEKNEKGLYLNRGDCFFKKNDYSFALLDYQQALELDPNDIDIKNRVAKIYYIFGVQHYDEKNYQDANKQFSMAIKYSPQTCKYYISRARTSYMQEIKEPAQVDICISILLDPVNQEIPTIIGRLFENQNLNDVMQSVYMKKAYEYLEKLNLKDHLKHPQVLLYTGKRFNKKSSENKKLEDGESLKKRDDDLHLELFEQKKLINKILKSDVKVDFTAIKTQKILPLPSEEEIQNNNNSRKNSKNKNELKKDYGWRKFNSGIALSK